MVAELRNLVLQLLLRFRELLYLATLVIEFQLCSTLLYDLGKGQFTARVDPNATDQGFSGLL